MAAEKGHLEACRLLKQEMTRRAPGGTEGGMEGGMEGGAEGGRAPVGSAAPVDLAGRTPLGWKVSGAHGGRRDELEQVSRSSLPPSLPPSLPLSLPFSLPPSATCPGLGDLPAPSWLGSPPSPSTCAILLPFLPPPSLPPSLPPS